MNFHPLKVTRLEDYEDLDAIQYRLWTGWKVRLRKPQCPLTSDTEGGDLNPWNPLLLVNL